MEQRRQQDPEHKFQMIPIQHILHGKECDRERKVVPHGIERLKVQPHRHKQEKGLRKADALSRKRPQKDPQCRKRKHSKHQLVALPSDDPVQKAHQPVKAGFRHHISAHISLMSSLRVLPIVIANIKAECRHAKEEHENTCHQQPVAETFCRPAPAAPHRLALLIRLHAGCHRTGSRRDRHVKYYRNDPRHNPSTDLIPFFISCSAFFLGIVVHITFPCAMMKRTAIRYASPPYRKWYSTPLSMKNLSVYP